MAELSRVILDMGLAGLPPLPPGHPICDGKERRFGPKKKAWYKLNQIDGTNGPRVYGVFGLWQGTSNGAIGVQIIDGEVSQEDMAAVRRRQEEAHQQEVAARIESASRAANRAKGQWQAGSDQGESPYLSRKQVPMESARVDSKGVLLVPVKRYARGEGSVLLGLQKIDADGGKRFNQGMEKIGGACLLGKLPGDAALIMLGEGYATVGSARLALHSAQPGVVAFDAGNLLPVAVGLRRDFPAAHILFLADDDWQIDKRLAKWLVKQFKIAATIVIDGKPYPLTGRDFDAGDLEGKLEKRLAAAGDSRADVLIDGVERILLDEEGREVRVTLYARQDANGVRYIEAHATDGRQVQSPKFENAGIAKAMAAAREVGNASVVWPRFAQRGDNKWSDFNDLHVEESLASVEAQLRAAVDHAMASPALVDTGPPPFDGDQAAPLPDQLPPAPSEGWAESKVTAVTRQSIASLLQHFALVYGSTDIWDGLNRQRIKRAAFVAAVGKDLAREWSEHEQRRTIDPDSLPVLRRGRAVPGGDGGDRLLEMLEKLTLLYGTVTVWDSDKRVVMSLDAVRAAYGGEIVKRWQEHGLRRMIDAANLVFDPTMQVSLATHINMFTGYPLVPAMDDDKCTEVLELLFDLCSAEDCAQEVFEWLLKWLAYPLQHPGAKMQTAVLMFGEKQGTGKSLFFEGIMRPIYGEYGGTAGQHQLDSNFTAWKSRKTYIVFEEVLSRDDRYSHMGTLKHMITGRDMRINEKNLPERVESNHLNSVFLSNESQPIPIELEDRRFLVIEARNKLTEERVEAIRKLMVGGVSAAFYHFLLAYPLGDFNPHSKPIMTEAKRKIIRFGRPGWDSFHEAWKAGDLSAPYCSCISEDLYWVYERWCDRTHERKLTLTKFSELLAGREVKERKRVTVGQRARQHMVFLIPCEEGKDVSLDKQVLKFRDLAGIKED